ncbi:MAG: SAM-dependent methyltransferase [Deltaproteobacteria bacterium]|nr:MAG: SAM-dependent methyltransferase [Deltaproteobacteria bacterium]
MFPDHRLDFPATHRNAAAIFDVLRRVLPREGLVLEIGSGSGQHGAEFARQLPAHRWQPSDPDPEHVQSIDAWRAHHGGLGNLLPALCLDVTQRPWAVESADAVICCNVVHIAPWEVALALFGGAGEVLPEGGLLYLYGPFLREEVPTTASNLRFDASLRDRDPRWGVRGLCDVREAAGEEGFDFVEFVEMPANNLSVIFRKRAGSS